MPFDQQNMTNNPAYYINRELSWLKFNQRVLEEAVDPTNPLLEQLRFLAIFSSNLDEFFMVRVAGLKDQIQAGFNQRDNKSQLTPNEQIAAITEVTHQLVCKQQQIYQAVLEDLEKHEIKVKQIKSLTKHELNSLESFFDAFIFPTLTPLAIDAYRPFPLLMNKSINIAVTLIKASAKEQTKTKTALVQVPALLNRFIQLPGKYHVVLTEEVIAHFLYKLFTGYTICTNTIFRITRNADLTIHEDEAHDLLKEIEKELPKRQWGAPVRLEVLKGYANPQLINFLLHELELEDTDLYIYDQVIDLTSLFSLYNFLSQHFEALTYQSLIPQRALDIDERSVFQVAKEKDILLHHPYESFEVVVEMLKAAAEDPDVLAIKQTLYRVSGRSPIIQSLKLAAQNGKQVTVLVELKARFDEENNVHWARALEKCGCHVIYGVNGLKTHSKITFIVRKAKNGTIDRFVHLGTGNYNEQTATVYTDMSLITTEKKFTKDASLFFNYVSGYSEKPKFERLTISPQNIREALIHLIDSEIQHQKTSKNGYIIAKMNALTDKMLITKLYEASQAGVKIDLIVRGICCLKPGIKGVSENISVRSIVGRFLEHSRVYYFHSDGEERIFLSSADMMTRNMCKRIELLFPIFQKSHQERIKKTLNIIIQDNTKARELRSDGSYHYVTKPIDQPLNNSQLTLYHLIHQQNRKHNK